MDPLFDFTGRVALVTGGSRGLGYQMVKAFAERGADVIIASRKLDNCEKVAEEMRALGRRALAVPAQHQHRVHVGEASVWLRLQTALQRPLHARGQRRRTLRRLPRQRAMQRLMQCDAERILI